MTVTTLKLLPLFHGLPEPDLLRLAEAATWEAYDHGDHVIQPGDPRDDVFVFVEGQGGCPPHRSTARRWISSCSRPEM